VEARFCTDLAKGVTLNQIGRFDDAVRLLKACAVSPLRPAWLVGLASQQ
jgi:hypothetical protein